MDENGNPWKPGDNGVYKDKYIAVGLLDGSVGYEPARWYDKELQKEFDAEIRKALKGRRPWTVKEILSHKEQRALSFSLGAEIKTRTDREMRKREIGATQDRCSAPGDYEKGVRRKEKRNRNWNQVRHEIKTRKQKGW